VIDVPRLLAESSLRHVEWLNQIDSTNTRALNLAMEPSVPVPFLIGADQQTAGRGRGTNSWWGAEGSLMFSIGIDMLELRLSAKEWPRFSLITGLAIAETIGSLLPSGQVGVKWPNDVWLNGRKVCGILIEQPDRAPTRLIVGIGINVNNSFSTAPLDQQRIATSLIDAAEGAPFPRTEVLIAFLSRWQSLVEQLANGTISLVQRWSHACVLSGRPITVTSGSQETTGICSGIDDDGCLLLRTAYSLERCYAGTVRLLD
jgi:BirA family biotin operon repressor/biotin-[acetyl-CoA-carboxylase] ligase